MFSDALRTIISDTARTIRASEKFPEDGTEDESLYDVLDRAGLIGCVKGGPPDVATNPKYMEGFGESDNETGSD